MADSELPDMSLDDYIAAKRREGDSGRGRGTGGRRGGFGQQRGGGAGPVRRRGSGGFRPSPYTRPSSDGGSGGQWQHDLYSGPSAGGRGGRGGASGGMDGGATLHISNLFKDVTNADLKELFSEFGRLKSVRVNYDEKGESCGDAIITFVRLRDAQRAKEQYHNVPLDDKPMKIRLEAIGGAQSESSGAFSRVGGGRGFSRGGGFRGGRGGGSWVSRGGGGSWGGGSRGGGGSWGSRGGNSGGRGRGRGRGRGGRDSKPTVTKEQLDAELDAYQRQATEES